MPGGRGGRGARDLPQVPQETQESPGRGGGLEPWGGALRGDIPVSPHTGRYSSCWMSSMISSPLPVPPFMVFSGGRPSRPELNV